MPIALLRALKNCAAIRRTGARAARPMKKTLPLAMRSPPSVMTCGGALLLRFIVRRLRIADVERRAAQVLRVRASAVRGAAPGLSYDVDTLADYRYACAKR